MSVRAQQPGRESGCPSRAGASAAHPYEAHWGVGYTASSLLAPTVGPANVSTGMVMLCPAQHSLWQQLVNLHVQPSQLHLISRWSPFHSRWSSYPLAPTRQPYDRVQSPAAATASNSSTAAHQQPLPDHAPALMVSSDQMAAARPIL
jgi:hypothetical protein